MKDGGPKTINRGKPQSAIDKDFLSRMRRIHIEIERLVDRYDANPWFNSELIRFNEEALEALTEQETIIDLKAHD